jgi:peptidoglycan/LPS O-acetylase OafA/YrhL
LGPFSPTWSLATEEQFYFVWPLVLFLLLRWRAKPWMIGLLLLSVITVLTAAFIPMTGVIHWYNEYFSPLDRFGELLVGCLAALIWQQGGQVLKVFRPALLGWLATAYLVYLLGGGYEMHLGARQEYWSAVVAAAILVLCLVQTDKGLLRWVFTFPPLRYLGRISYGLYLYQLPIDMVIKRYFPQYSWPDHDFANFAILSVASVAVSALSWHLMESRFLRRKSPNDPDTSGLVARVRLRLRASEA